MAKPLIHRHGSERDVYRALEHIREAEALRRKYGDVFEDVKRTFLNLPQDTFNELLEEYGRIYGQAAKEYALRTMRRWRSGGVIMSGQTMTRLLDLVPKHLTAHDKYALIEKIRLETLRKLRRSEVKVRLRADDSVINSLGCVLDLIQQQAAVELPRSFYELRGWIHAEDAMIMQDLVLSLEKEAVYARAVDLFYQVALLQEVRRVLPHAKLIQVTFDLPTARVVVAINRPRRSKRMQSTPDPDNDLLLQLQKIETEQRYQSGDIGFHEYVLRNIDTLFTPEQLAELRALAVKQGLELDRLKSEIVVKGQTSAHDIKSFVTLVEDLKKKGTKADVTGKYTTPSGQIEIKAKTARFGCTILPFGLFTVAVLVSLMR
jgi:hypothetical protein